MHRIILQPTGGDTQKNFIEEGYISWAIKDTPNFRKIWQESIGNIVLFVNKGNIFAIAKVDAIKEEHEKDYPLRYCWNENIKYVDLPIDEFNKIVGYKSNFSPRGYMLAREYNIDKVFEFLEIYEEGSDKTPREKKPLININGKEEYPRDENIKNHALKDAHYQCELDESHISFISQKTAKNYVEGHHLIPVNQHSKFKYDLDVSENIISLCPECHRMLHHAEKRQIRSGLSKLLEQRSDALKEVGLDISLDELVEVY